MDKNSTTFGRKCEVNKRNKSKKCARTKEERRTWYENGMHRKHPKTSSSLLWLCAFSAPHSSNQQRDRTQTKVPTQLLTSQKKTSKAFGNISALETSSYEHCCNMLQWWSMFHSLLAILILVIFVDTTSFVHATWSIGSPLLLWLDSLAIQSINTILYCHIWL